MKKIIDMQLVNIHEAKTHFSKIVDAAAHGKNIVIGMAGKPVAILGPIPVKPARKFGILKGKIKISKDFDSPLPEEYIRDFEG